MLFLSTQQTWAAVVRALNVKAIQIYLPKNSKVAWVVRDITDVTLVRDDGKVLRAHKLNI
jgi:hypothetical protein